MDKFKDSSGEVHINKMHEAFPHLYDKNDKKKGDFFAEFDETNKNLIIETTINDGTQIKERTERFIFERRKFIAEEQKKINELTVIYNRQLIAMETMLSDRDLKEFTKADCCRSMYDQVPEGETSNKGKVCIISLACLAEEYRKPEYQLFRLEGGFGCSPTNGGNACFGKFCADGSEARMERYDFIGVGNDEVEKIAKELEAGWSGGTGANAEQERAPEM